MRKASLLILPGLALAGCATLSGAEADKPSAQVIVEERSALEWQGYASQADIDRIALLDEAWKEALATARKAGFVTAMEREGRLLVPDAGLRHPDPTPGSYSCRLVKLGGAAKGDPAFIAYKPFFCYVEIENDRFTIVKQTGSQRPAGRLWDAGDHYIFLGSLVLGNESEPLAYGEDPERDMAGVWERIGPFRWRLAIPYPRNGGILDLFELTPVADQPE
ncbi:DUF4893 domain-containing protein [Sphingomicrobium lutaoense]|uniref:DUF4893 domain-containing protein n=1 Tax=Sphingomicrobium lutaoense TaxID=515949 RepID=A0A839YVN8_9SPHN|nr:DUF4893 domain-containing protein [Sphingomicrobium lutaoense]MBB3763086.1 hypothetical protein [Sphingomicrobium lutaoense]